MRSPFGLLFLAGAVCALNETEAPSPAPVAASTTTGTPVAINAPLFDLPTPEPTPVMTTAPVVQGGAQTTEAPVSQDITTDTEAPVAAPVEAPTEAPVVLASDNATTTETPVAAPSTEAPVAAVAATEAPVAAPVDDTATTEAPEPASEPAPVQTPQTPIVAPRCYSNLTDVSIAVEKANPFIQSTYVICPNTVLEIGYPGSDGLCCVGPNEPLQPRSNSHYLCGEDGNPENNCTLIGGQFQVLASKTAYNREDTINVKIQGFTFASGGSTGALLVTSGDIEFIDCTFRDHRNSGAVNMLYFFRPPERFLSEDTLMDMDRRQRAGTIMNYYANILKDPKAMEEYRAGARAQIAHDTNRLLQGDPIVLTRQKITFTNCRFYNNTYGEPGQLSSYGIIKAETNTNDLTLRDTIFEDNAFGDDKTTTDSFAVRTTEGCTLAMTNTCFIGNDFLGKGPVHVVDESVILENNGNFATFDENVKCQHIAVGDEPTCVAFDSNKCLVREGGATDVDNPGPVPTPSSSPTTLKSNTSSSLPMRYALSLLGAAAATFCLIP